MKIKLYTLINLEILFYSPLTFHETIWFKCIMCVVAFSNFAITGNSFWFSNSFPNHMIFSATHALTTQLFVSPDVMLSQKTLFQTANTHFHNIRTGFLRINRYLWFSNGMTAYRIAFLKKLIYKDISDLKGWGWTTQRKDDYTLLNLFDSLLLI